MDLFDQSELQPTRQEILKDIVLLRAFALSAEREILDELTNVTQATLLRKMYTAGGKPMSVMTASCGDLGWVSDHQGYRYAAFDPLTRQPWPAMPASFRQLAQQAAELAGFAGFEPDTCLINRYASGAKMGLHQDKDEQDFTQPIVSVSLGIPAIFQMGGHKRSDQPLKLPLYHGDVLVWGGESRLRFHGVMPVKEGSHPAFGAARVNLTFRKAG